MIVEHRTRFLSPVAGLAVASLASAAGPVPGAVSHPIVGAAACADVQSRESLSATWPGIAGACPEVVASNATLWARFAGTCLHRDAAGTVTAKAAAAVVRP